MEAHEIVVCMGSSCFARGNRRTLEAIRESVARLNVQARVLVKGCLCEGACREGPHVRVDGVRHDGVNPAGARELIERLAAGAVAAAEERR
jgi:NADH:ubiquinone oxidoreductase subunit E